MPNCVVCKHSIEDESYVEIVGDLTVKRGVFIDGELYLYKKGDCIHIGCFDSSNRVRRRKMEIEKNALNK